MSESQTLLLGFIAGVTIFIGLPIGRVGTMNANVRTFLTSLAVGILTFLVWDVLTHAYVPLDGALGNLHEGSGSFGPVAGYGALFLGGIAAGLLSLVYYERLLAKRRPRPFPPGSMSVAEARVLDGGHAAHASPARRLALMIAMGIGLHNFGEGLAIGGSAATGAISLATILVIGFALHNATEGFGIVAPLAATGEKPSWGQLGLLGLIGGGPTFIGTAVGRQFTSDAMSVLFLALAAGSILYVVVQLIGVVAKAGRRDVMYWGILAGLSAGFITDMIVTAAGA